MRAPYCTKLKYLKVQKRSSLNINVKSLEVSLPLWSKDDRMDAHQGKLTTHRHTAKNRGSDGFNTWLSTSSTRSSVIRPNQPTKPQQPHQLAEPTHQHTNTNTPTPSTQPTTRAGWRWRKRARGRRARKGKTSKENPVNSYQ